MITSKELLDDGQEEVFSRTAIERGLNQDPLALDPAELPRRQPHPSANPRRKATGAIVREDHRQPELRRPDGR